MQTKLGPGTRQALALLGIALLLFGTYAWAQNLGAAPQTNVAVQGETRAQPEGAFLNFINWVGNVIAPVGSGSFQSRLKSGCQAARVAGDCGRSSSWFSPQCRCRNPRTGRPAPRPLPPADLEAISNTARRFTFKRAPEASELPPPTWADFEKGRAAGARDGFTALAGHPLVVVM